MSGTCTFVMYVNDLLYTYVKYSNTAFSHCRALVHMYLCNLLTGLAS